MRKELLLTLCMCLVYTFAYAEDHCKDYILWYNKPAYNRGATFDKTVARGFPYDEDWEHWSLPLGNGYMGVNVFGRTDVERIQITEKTLSNRGPHNRGGLTNFAEIYLDIHHEVTSKYKRTLSLNDAISTVKYEYQGVNYSRECFANYPSNIIALKLKADQPQSISLTVRPKIPYLNCRRSGDARMGTVTANKDLITLAGEMEFFKLPFEAQVKVVNYGGLIKATNNPHNDEGCIVVNHADSLILYIAAGTSYQLRPEVFTLPVEQKCAGNEHPHRIVSKRIDRAVAMGYEALKIEHLADYRPLFNRADISLSKETPNIPTDELIASYKNGKHHKFLEELYFQFGRYLLIASSRAGALPATLQGGWTQYDYSPWSSGYWHNINIQMNYWPAFNTNLAELFVPFMQYNEAYRREAQNLAIDYLKRTNPEAISDQQGENGWTIGTGATAYGIGGPGGHSGPGTGGFTTKLYWDYFDFTRNTEILKEHVYPALEGMAKFLIKTLKDDGKGHLLVSPSFSPENRHKGIHYKTEGCTFDQCMVWENFNDLLKAARLLKKESSFLKEIKHKITLLDPILIGKSGQLKEYREEQYYGDIGEPNHRHISHLCSVCPGTLVNSNHPDWIRAAKVSLERRGALTSHWVGWPVALKMDVWARLKEGEKAYQYYQTLLSKGVLENLWGLCPPFQVDSNFGGTFGVAEMLLQSHEEFIDLLPALPKAWENGSFRGLVARGNFVINATWENSHIQTLDILSRMGESCSLKHMDLAKAKVMDANGKLVKFKVITDDHIIFKTKRGMTYKLCWNF